MQHKDYEVWLAKVESFIERDAGGICIDDMPDLDFRAWYQCSYTPQEASQAALDAWDNNEEIF